jgi:two-component system sensor histidine kinase VicK
MRKQFEYPRVLLPLKSITYCAFSMPEHLTETLSELPFLQGGGEMGKMIRLTDWASTSLGLAETWPVELKNMVSMMLTTTFPVLICWGPDYIQLYNDAFRPINGETKHPRALGGAAKETYAEIWETIGPMFAGVMGGQSVGFPDFMVPLDRNGYLEDCYFDFSYSPIRNAEGHIGGILVICMETTVRVKHIERLQISEQRFQNLVRDATVGIIVLIGEEMRVGVVNEAYGRLIGRSANELRGQPLFTIIPETESVFRPIVDQVRLSGEPLYLYEYPYFAYKDGEKIDGFLNLVYQPYREADGRITGVMVLCQDVTEQVNTKVKIGEAEERARLATEAADLGTFDYSVQTDHFITSPRCDEIMGVERNSADGFADMIHPEDQHIRLKSLERAYETGKLFYVLRVIKSEGTRWVQAEGKVYYDAEGKPFRILGTMMDITEYRQNEIRKGDFIGMVSHELKTPLTSLTAIVQVANSKLKKSDDAFLAGAMDKAYIQVRKMSNMINGFLNISRLESGEIPMNKESFAIDQVIREIISEVQLTASQTIRFEPCEEISVYADQDKIGSVLSNLLSNAVKYSPKNKEIRVRCERKGRQVEVSVEDKGIGIAPQDIDQLFDRYYRVDNKDTAHIAGFGIGLYLAAEIVKRHDGKIGVTSEPGKGSTFYFSLPNEGV